MTGRYKDLKLGSLDEYITPYKFRTISEDMRSIPMGISEYAVEVHMKNPTKSKLSFKSPWDGIIYGCARDKRDVMNKLNTDSDIKTAYLTDWDDRFLFMIETQEKEYPIMYVAIDDIINLLENCQRIPEQKKKKKDAERND